MAFAIERKVSSGINHLHWLEIDERRSRINDIMIHAHLQYITKYNLSPKICHISEILTKQTYPPMDDEIRR